MNLSPVKRMIERPGVVGNMRLPTAQEAAHDPREQAAIAEMERRRKAQFTDSPELVGNTGMSKPSAVLG